MSDIPIDGVDSWAEVWRLTRRLIVEEFEEKAPFQSSCEYRNGGFTGIVEYEINEVMAFSVEIGDRLRVPYIEYYVQLDNSIGVLFAKSYFETRGHSFEELREKFLPFVREAIVEAAVVWRAQET